VTRMSQLVASAQQAAPQRTRVAPLVRGEEEAGGVARSAVRDFEHLVELCGGVPYAFPTAANRVAAVVSLCRRRRLRCRRRRSCCRQQCLRLAELGSLSCSFLLRLTSSPLLFVAASGAGSAEPIRRCRRRRSSTPAARGPWRTACWCRLHASSSPPRGAGRGASEIEVYGPSAGVGPNADALLLLERCIAKRPLVFMGPTDTYVLRSGASGGGRVRAVRPLRRRG
jgi:hypothetical protein